MCLFLDVYVPIRILILRLANQHHVSVFVCFFSRKTGGVEALGVV